MKSFRFITLILTAALALAEPAHTQGGGSPIHRAPRRLFSDRVSPPRIARWVQLSAIAPMALKPTADFAPKRAPDVALKAAALSNIAETPPTPRAPQKVPQTRANRAKSHQIPPSPTTTTYL